MEPAIFGKGGSYPAGVVNADEVDSLELLAMRDRGFVLIDFGTDVSWIGLRPKTAREIARALLKHADTIEEDEEK